MNQKLANIKTRQARELSSLKIGEGDVRYLSIKERQNLHLLHELHNTGEKIHITGRGTNSVYGSYSGIVVSIDILGLDWVGDLAIRASAGEDWQTVVDASVSANLHGIERLTLIPGTVGAAPVQNIGAFGQILSDRINTIEVYDIVSNHIRLLTAEECGFGSHRASNFKKPEWKHLVIISVTLTLMPSSMFVAPSGEGLMTYAEEKSLPYSDVASAEQLVAAFRGTLYPDYRVTPNCGSYFTNYEISKEAATSLPPSIWEVRHRETQHGAAIMFQCKDLLRSVGIEAGYKFSGGLMMHPKFNNFLINTGDATVRDLMECHKIVNERLNATYGIALIPEPEFVDDTVV